MKTDNAHIGGCALPPVVQTPRSDEACEDAEVWASRNPKGPVVPYRLAARMERELYAVRKILSEILDGVPMRYPKPCNFVINVSHRKIEAARAAINSSNPSHQPPPNGGRLDGVVGTPNQKGEA